MNIYGISFEDEKMSIPFNLEEKEEYVGITISKDFDFSNVKTVVCDYFGEITDVEDDGYMLLPRGDNCYDFCLCYFNRHKQEFSKDLGENNIPIYGIKSRKVNFVGIVSGMRYDYTLRIVQECGKYRVFPVYKLNGEQPCEDIKIEYHILHGDEANYSSMARIYRNFRLERGEIVPISERMKNNKSLEYSKDSVMIRIRCGWKPAPAEVKHQNLENEPPMYAACTFKRIGELLDELKRQGVDKADICLVGWNVKGHDGRWPQAFPVADELGGEEELRNLIKKAQSMGYHINCHTNSTDQYEIADVFSLDNTRTDASGNHMISEYVWSGGEMHELCPEVALKQAKETLPKVLNLGFRGTHYIDVLGSIHPRRCYTKEHYVTTEQSVSYSQELCSYAKELFGGVSAESAHDAVAPFLDYGLYIDAFSFAGKELCDESVPLWQLIYHGTVLSNPYPETVNYTFKDQSTRLKFIEYGGRPSYYFYSVFMNNGFNWMGNNDARCGDKEQMEESVKKVKQGYDEYKKLLYLQTEFMDKHEKIDDNIFKVTYSDGTIITVDYNTQTYSVGKEN